MILRPKIGRHNRQYAVCDNRPSAFVGTRGFSLVEILVVIVILAVAAAIVIPMASNASSVQAQAAADMVYADLEYVRGLAMSQGQVYRVTFNTTNESYHVDDRNGALIDHPVLVGEDFTYSFPGSRLGNVNIVSVNFDGDDIIAFDYLSVPRLYDSVGDDYDDELQNTGTIVLQAGSVQTTVSIEPQTGNITVQ